MNKKIKEKLIKIAEKEIRTDDPAHDFNHAMQVLKNAENICKKEGGNLDIIIPAALFHDVIVYKKNSPKSYKSQEDSAIKTANILKKIKYFSKEVIEKIQTCIIQCSYTKNIKPSILESKILQDADLLESTGAITIMRLCASSGQLKRPLYCFKDPFAKKRTLERKKYSLDYLFFKSIKVDKRLNTKTALKIAKRRISFLKEFLKELKLELREE